MPIWKRTRAKKDVWIADYSDATGKRHRVTAKTKREAENLLAARITERQDPLPPQADIPFPEYADRWMAHIAAQLKPRTVESYAQLLRLHLMPRFQNVKLRDIARAQVKQLIADKRGQGLSKNTVRLIRATLSVMLAEAVDDGLLKANPAALASRRRSADSVTTIERQKAIRPFEGPALAAFLEAARSHEYHALFLTLARTGMRPGEAFALEWPDIDFDKREILIERALSAGRIGSTKTGRARHADMSQELAATLRGLWVEREKETLRRGRLAMPALIFINAQGNPLDESRVRKQFARILRRAELSGHRLYDLRHSYATTLLARGVPITYVAAQLGHAKPTTTLQWYAHWLPREDKAYVDALDDAASPCLTFGRKKPRNH